MANRTFLISLFTVALTVFCATADETSSPLMVSHKAPTGAIPRQSQFQFMHYYRTEITNTSDRPLRIVWFEGYEQVDGVWYPGNVLGRALRGGDFANWYTEGHPTPNGVIPPGKTGVCDVNYHGNNSPGKMTVKWAYIAVDDEGNDFYAEGIVDPSVIRHVKYGPSNQALQPTQ